MGILASIRSWIMWTFLEKLLGLSWLGDLADRINGNKTVLGIIAIVIHMLNIVPQYLPQYGFAPDIANSIQELLKWVGVLFPWGAAHKVSKLMVKES